MFSSHGLISGSHGLLLIACFLYGCQAESLRVQGPGTPEDPDGPPADLAPGPIEAPPHLPLDAVLEMRVGVRNGGGGPAGPGWVVQVYLSTDPIIDSSDKRIDQFVATRELPSGGEDRYLRHKKLSRVAPGNYFLGSILDVTHIVPEPIESNNVLTTPSTITLLDGLAAW